MNEEENDKLVLSIPEYLTIDNYTKLQDVKSLKTPKDIINIISLISGGDPEVIAKMEKKEVDSVAQSIFQMFTSNDPKFWAIFELNGITYGFSPPSKWTLGEWIDAGEFSKNWKTNMNKLMALLYRPITKHNWKTPIWKAKYHFKLLANQPTNPFNVYEVEDYDSSTVDERSEILKNMPINIAQGAMAFFLAIGMELPKSSTTSLTPSQLKGVKEIQQMTLKSLFNSTTVGS
jgi:hypothetical protein|tara:strand:- start:1930 stop:2625 length:696 start_codon:yes stop_codon:yes gene_type:complete